MMENLNLRFFLVLFLGIYSFVCYYNIIILEFMVRNLNYLFFDCKCKLFWVGVYSW